MSQTRKKEKLNVEHPEHVRDVCEVQFAHEDEKLKAVLLNSPTGWAFVCPDGECPGILSDFEVASETLGNAELEYSCTHCDTSILIESARLNFSISQ